MTTLLLSINHHTLEVIPHDSLNHFLPEEVVRECDGLPGIFLSFRSHGRLQDGSQLGVKGLVVVAHLVVQLLPQHIYKEKPI